MTKDQNPDDDPVVAHGVRRTVGIATLRRLHRMIDDEKHTEATDARFARRLGIACGVAALLTVAWMAFR